MMTPIVVATEASLHTNNNNNSPTDAPSVERVSVFDVCSVCFALFAFSFLFFYVRDFVAAVVHSLLSTVCIILCY